jgi:hypothetical protein
MESNVLKLEIHSARLQALLFCFLDKKSLFFYFKLKFNFKSFNDFIFFLIREVCLLLISHKKLALFTK